MKQSIYRGIFSALLILLILPFDLESKLFAQGRVTISAGKAVKVEPVNLRCEYIREPCGVDIEKPRLSWNYSAPGRPANRLPKVSVFSAKKTESTETKSDSSSFVLTILKEAPPTGWRQTNWRVLVSDSLDELQQNRGNCWDSGWVNSDQMDQIEYAGKKLRSDTTYFWKVFVKGNDGRERVSAPASWSTGLFSQKDWTAKWIGSDTVYDPKVSGDECNFADPWLRKTFTIEKKPKRAVLFAAAIGYQDIYINGKKWNQAGPLAPNVSDYTHRARYIAYDITDGLVAGKNVIAIWLGPGWSIFPPYYISGVARTPQVIAQSDLYFADGSKQRIVTDASWKVHSSPNRLVGTWSFGNYGGERWDANKEVPNWNGREFDDSSWANATIYQPHPLRHPGTEGTDSPEFSIGQDSLVDWKVPFPLSAQFAEGNAEIIPVRAQSVEACGKDTWRIDMGTNFVGFMRMKIKGAPGDTIEFRYSEREQDAMTFRIRSKYTIGPSGEGVFENRHNYHSGRWITVYGLKYRPLLSDFTGTMIRTDYEQSADFACSDDLLNWIYDRVLWTFENLSLGGYVVDCPQRERFGYGGDAHATTETGMYNFHLPAFYTKWMEDWRDVQGRTPCNRNLVNPAERDEPGYGNYYKSGLLPNTAPTYYGGGGPAWGGICVSLPWYLYNQYNDTRVLKDNFELISDWLAFLETHTKDGLLEQYGDQWSFLGDWLWPGAHGGPNSSEPETLFFNNCYRVFNLVTAAKIAKTIGRTDKAKLWNEQAELSRKAIHKKYFNSKENTYFNSSQGTLGTALLAEIPPAEVRSKILARLERQILVNDKGHIGVGITAGSMLFRYLRQENRNDLIYKMVTQKGYPGFEFMRECGATTIWEAWEKDRPGHSLLHSSYLFPGAWYIDSLLGIRPDSTRSGYQNFVVRPPKWNELPLDRAEGWYNSTAGCIQVGWKKNGSNGGQLKVSVPANTKATVYVASLGSKDLIKASAGAEFLREEGEYAVYSIPSGNYQFEVKR